MDNATDVRAARPEQKNSAELKRHLIAGGVFYFENPDAWTKGNAL
jgi:hypothetical protein